MKSNSLKSIGAKIIGTIILIALVFGAGVYIGYDNGTSHVRAAEKVDMSGFWKVWDILNEKYVPASTTVTISDEARVYGAIEGLVESLGDPYTLFLPPTELKTFEEDIKGNFEGVGMEVGMRDEILTVIAPLKNTPAYNAGIKAGDKILAIEGNSTAKMSVDDAIKLIRGKAGTTVKITIFREGEKAERDVTLTRAVINVPAIETELRSDNIFVIRLSSFSALSADQFKKALREFVNSKSNSLILDLRNNPGGYLEAAVDIASWFLPSGKVVVTEDFGGNIEPEIFRSRGYDVFSPNLKLVVLVNQGSASASEILAGALSEHKKAVLVGEKTFGKGSVQELIPVDKAAVKVTIARWLTPNGNSISLKGIMPDYEVKLTDKDREGGKDPQMEKAVEIIKTLK